MMLASSSKQRYSLVMGTSRLNEPAVLSERWEPASCLCCSLGTLSEGSVDVYARATNHVTDRDHTIRLQPGDWGTDNQKLAVVW